MSGGFAGVKTDRPRPTAIIKDFMGYNYRAEHVLCLVYLPASSVNSGNLLDNATMNQIIKPVIGSTLEDITRNGIMYFFSASCI